MKRFLVAVLLLSGLSACTEESRNKIARQADNYLGQDLQVSYIDGGKVVKTWTVRDGKITSAKPNPANRELIIISGRSKARMYKCRLSAPL